MKRSPLIVDIKRHSLEDGPGIRSVVFFKGCPMRCVFCHNPESVDPRREIAFSSGSCIACGDCAKACDREAVDMNDANRILRTRCNLCGKCAEACPTGSIKILGKRFSPEEIEEVLLRDRNFYRHSGGGVTLSGGECTMWPDFLEPLLKSLKGKKIHILLETSGFFHYESFRKKILPYLDTVYFDLKIHDSRNHRRHTGRSNERILANFRRLVREKGVDVLPRVPIIPGITDTRENLEAIVDFLCGCGSTNIQLLPYNPMWIQTARNLGRPIPPLPESFQKPDEEEKTYGILKEIIAEKKRNISGIASKKKGPFQLMNN